MSILLNSIKNNNEMSVYVGYQNQIDDDLISLLESAKYKIDITNINKSFVSYKNLWIQGEVYSRYPNQNSYIIVDNVRVYVCVSNNTNSLSLVKPTHRSLFNLKESDGYVWRYLFDIETNDIFNYFRHNRTTKTVPVKNSLASINTSNTNVTHNNNVTYYVDTIRGSGSTFEYDIDTNGFIKNITVTYGGENYHKRDVFIMTDNQDGTGASVDFHISNGQIVVDTFTNGTGYQEAKCFVVGDGTGASIDVTVSGGAVDSVNLVSGGSSYTWAKIYILSSENSHCSTITLESKNSFGYDFTDDLIGSKLLLSVLINVPSGNDDVNYLILTSKQDGNELPEIYVINRFNDITLSTESENVLGVFLSG